MQFYIDKGWYRGTSFVSHERVFEAIPITFSAVFHRALMCNPTPRVAGTSSEACSILTRICHNTIGLNDMNIIDLALFDEN
jgi:hypothetical protein